jgi:hypothetical protein
MQDKDICGEPPSVALVNFMAELHCALNESDYENAAIALTSCVVLIFAEQIKPLQYSQEE